MNARRIFVVVLIVFGLSGSTLIADVNDGLISHWRFDEGGGSIAYDSAGTNDGTIYGATWVAGKINGALDFDGDDYVEVSDDPELRFTQYDSFSICAWAKPIATTLVCKMRASGQSGFFGYKLAEDISNYRFTAEKSMVSSISVYTREFPPDDWSHVTAVYDNKNMKIYMDGELEDAATFTLDTGNTAPDKDLTIGARSYDSIYDDYFKGLIDDVRIYDRALSAEEVWEVYQVEMPNLIGLEIIGPGEVAENFSTSYKAIAYFDDDSTRDVTNSSQWFVEPGAIASIEAGLLTTKDIIRDELATIWASYSEGDVAFEAEKTINILAICPTGTALSFDGVDDYVEIGDKLNNVNIPFSIAAWINAGGEGTRMIFCSDDTGDSDSGNYHGFYFAVGTGNSLGVTYGDGSGAGSSNRRSKNTAQTTIQNNTWTFVAVVVRGATDMDLYKDGIDAGGYYHGSGGDMVHNEYKAVIGMQSRWGPDYFTGLIDEVAIYNKALSGEEIRAGMHVRLAGDEPGLVGYWDFDEGMGQIVYDLSGNGNDGQLGSTAEVDGSDPAWIESDAPVGLCTPYLIATAAAKKALKYKEVSLKALEAALAQEWIMYEALEQWLEEEDFGDLRKGDIVKAGQKAHSAIQHEGQSIDMLGKGLEKLLDSLSSLGYGPQQPPPPPP